MAARNTATNASAIVSALNASTSGAASRVSAIATAYASRRLTDPATRAKIRAEILQPSTAWENQYLGSGGAAGILVSAVGRAELKSYQGRTLDDIAKAEGKDPLDVLFDLIAKDDTTGSGIMFFINETDMRAALAHPLVMLGTDSGGMAPDSGPLR